MVRKNPIPEPDLSERLQQAWAAAGNTWDVIDWDALRERLRDAPAGLTEANRVALMVRVANGARLTELEWNQLVGATVLRGRDHQPPTMPDLVRAFVASRLQIIVEGTDKKKDELADAAAAAASIGVLLVPSWSRQDGRVDRILAEDIPGAVAYGIWLLSDPTKPFRDQLCRCQYSQCGIFFFRVRGKGAPRRYFCSTEHGHLGNTEKAKTRMQIHRRKNRK